MNEAFQDYIQKYSKELQVLFVEVQELIIKGVPCKIEEKLWAKIPSYYVDKNFVRIIPFKDHINIEALAIIEHRTQLEQYKITPKGMLQIYLNQDIPSDALQVVFRESLIRLKFIGVISRKLRGAYQLPEYPKYFSQIVGEI